MKSWDRLNGKYTAWQFSTATSCLPLLFNTGIDWRMRQSRQLSVGLLEYHFSGRLNKPTGLDHTVRWEILINWLNTGDYHGQAVNNTSFIISVSKQVPANYQCPAPGWDQHSITLLLCNNNAQPLSHTLCELLVWKQLLPRIRHCCPHRHLGVSFLLDTQCKQQPGLSSSLFLNCPWPGWSL